MNLANIELSSANLFGQDRRGLFGCLHIVLRDCAQDEAYSVGMPAEFIKSGGKVSEDVER